MELEWYKWIACWVPIISMLVAVVFLGVVVVIAVLYSRSLGDQLEESKARVMELVEKKGSCEARVQLFSEKDEHERKATSALMVSSDRVLDMLKHAQESFLIGRGEAEKKKDKCHEKLELLHFEIRAMQGNITKFVEEREKFYHLSHSCSDELERFKQALRMERLKIDECQRQKMKCWC